MIFGNRLVSINSGGAPISENISRFFEEKLKLPLPSLYGCREAGPIAMNGVIYPGIEVIVLPVPELGLRGYESGKHLFPSIHMRLSRYYFWMH